MNPDDSKNGTLLETDSSEGGEIHVVTSITEEHLRRLTENRRRLDKIVEEGFAAIDSCIYDTPNPPLGLRRRHHVPSGDPCYMSGAFEPHPGPSHIGKNPFILKSIENDEEFPIDPAILSEGHMQGAELSNYGLQGDEGQNQSTLSVSDSGPAGSSAPSTPSRNPFVIMAGQHVPFVLVGQHETPVPAPQPWKQLGVADPFAENSQRSPSSQTMPHSSHTQQAEETSPFTVKAQSYGVPEPNPSSMSDPPSNPPKKKKKKKNKQRNKKRNRH
ncbi:hypothetical protein O1611_g9483 [Lasiodiplodia mahajangana]|uniref:Uncharacterized protein n=1 Tax=Lasiodiplodia mahajangana TaxID=1108764 RepID=A0ACC2J8V3_9PEZI|nr:hypothetical protein O1611_g9483 [Lasiodiplodia mahajangana]